LLEIYSRICVVLEFVEFGNKSNQTFVVNCSLLFSKNHLEVFSRVLEYGECKKNQNGTGSCLWQVNSVQQMNETLKAKQFPFRMWRRLWPQEVSMKQDALVMVRGKVQSKASVESKDKNHDTGVLTAQNVDEKAVYLERTQTVSTCSSLSHLQFLKNQISFYGSKRKFFSEF
jgi:DNA polymerase III sliding clamp (beta) subunit (PCNA family)